MFKHVALTGLLLSSAAFANSYRQALQTLNNAPKHIQETMNSAPAKFEFEGQFGANSSVSYPGQAFRQVLIEDIKSAMTSQPRGSYPDSKAEANNMLMSYYAYDEMTALTGVGVIDGFSEFKIGGQNLQAWPLPIYEGFIYSDIQSPGKNLVAKIAGNDNSLRRGKLFGTAQAQTPDKLVLKWFDMFAQNAVEGDSFTVPNGELDPQTITQAHITENGLDLAQLTQKFFHGAVSYSQAARDYLSTELGDSKGLNADNSKPAKQGAAYTALEHHFDEAFGYFGAAQDYQSYTDLERRKKLSIDTNNDGFISVMSERNQGISTNTARIDLTAADQSLDLTNQAMGAFLKGRHLITQKPEGYLPYVVAQAQVALNAWEKTLAGVTIHYINNTIREYAEYGSTNYLYKDFVKFWGEMKGFAFAFQFNPKASMDDETFDRIHELMRDEPVLPHASKLKVSTYVADLLAARELIGRAYDFSDENVASW
jgi:hypothetical protein